ncbi:MAG: intradiol ring-cleavage dioxygenase [bacterium]|nr:intradiol ring-cleavage dioxygenase [bacterium]
MATKPTQSALPPEADNDDEPVGRILSRREILKLLGGAGAVMVIGAGVTRSGAARISAQTTTPTAVPATPAVTGTASAPFVPACVVRPALTEGPYFVDTLLERSDIRVEPSTEEPREGAQLDLMFRVYQIESGGCTPLENAQVDIWHCDADGLYSGVSREGTSGTSFLRGYQLTDAEGVAQFITIYPGWYPGRAVHIHFKVRVNGENETGYEFTSQLFFPEALTDIVHAEPPYAAKGMRNTLNETDGIYGNNGYLLLLDPEENEYGYSAVFEIALDLNAETTAQQQGPGGPARGTPAGRP